MRLFRTIAGLRSYLSLQKFGCNPSKPLADSNRTRPGTVVDVGFVPTMGALHQGHLSLVQRARQENALVIVSIFVNPLQFGPAEDFDKYPRLLEQDAQLCEQAGVDVLFVPDPIGLGVDQRDSLTQVLPPESLMRGLCGASRPGHFVGVATIVTKLLNLVQPDRAYFGQKDAQQLAIIRQFVADLNLPTEIIGCPIIREPSGLACSSRNQYLNESQKLQAAVLYRSLKKGERCLQSGQFVCSEILAAVRSELATEPAVIPEYIELVDPRTMQSLSEITDQGLLAIAARVGSTRLIDNLVLKNRRPIVAIDGPAGAGKSTVTRLVAQALDLLYLDTGAMYRAITWLVLQSQIAFEDEPAIAELVSQCRISMSGQSSGLRIQINDQDVTEAIRSLEVTARVSQVAAQAAVRQQLVQQQRQIGQQGGLAAEGRDIGTFVFPDAELKIFLTASVQERARRRQQDLKAQGAELSSLDELEQAIYERDLKDSTRTLSPLRKAADAIEIQTDHLTIPEVVNQIVQLYGVRIEQATSA